MNNNIEIIIKELGIEVKKYWEKILHTKPSYEIGVVKSSGKLLVGHNLAQLCDEMSYLATKTDIYLPLVLGGGIQYDQLPAHKDSKKINGIRITSGQLMEGILPLAKQNQINTVEALKASGVDAVAIHYDSIKVVPHGPEKDESGKLIDTGLVGDIINIDTKPIIDAILNKQVPVLSHIGISNGKYYNINATTVATELVKHLQAKKLILLGDSPVFDKENKIIHTIYSENEAKKLISNGTVNKGMITNIKDAYDLLNILGPGHSVQITSLKYSDSKLESTGLLEELLGSGSGTQILIPHTITGYPYGCIDNELLTDQINGVFLSLNKKLVSDYFDLISTKNATIYLDGMKAGGAITYPIEGCEFMCKLFTNKDYEGLGIGTSLIETILLQKGAIAWRSSLSNNKGNCFYDKIANHYDEMPVETDEYKIYMIGVQKDKQKSIIEQVTNIPATFEKMIQNH